MSSRIRVARIIARVNVGGPARHVAWLTAGLADRFETLLITGRIAPGEDDMMPFVRSLSVEPLVLGDMSRAISWRDALVVLRLWRELRRFRPNIVHTHTAKAGMAGRVAALLYRITSRRHVRLVHTFHGHVFHGYYGRLMTGVFLTVERFLARFTDKILVLSPRQLEEINGRFRIGRREQFQVVPLGLDLTLFAQPATVDLRRELGIDSSTFVAGIVGRLVEIKDHAFLLDAFAQLNDRNVQLLIIGDGHLRVALEQRAFDLGITDRVRFLGNRDDPEVFYRALDLLVLTSRNEGTPLSIIEAMAAEVPVLSTAVGGVPDLLGDATRFEDGVTLAERGVMIAPGDTTAFVSALRMLVDDAELREALAARAGAFVRERYDKARLLRDVAALYGRLMGD